MSRYIDADKLKDNIDESFDMQDVFLPYHFLAFIDAQPTADVAEIVRCKDCKYWDNTTKWAVCTRWSADPYEQATTEKNDFCSYGEKNE